MKLNFTYNAFHSSPKSLPVSSRLSPEDGEDFSPSLFRGRGQGMG